MTRFKDLIKKPWTWTILPALLFALPFSLSGGWLQWLSLSLILYLISLIFTYKKAIWLALFALSLLPSFTTVLISQLHSEKAFSSLEQVVFFFIFFLSLGLSYFLARRRKIIPPIALKEFPLGKICLGFGALFLTSLFVNLLAQALGLQTSTENQEALDKLAQIIPLGIFATQTIFAGFFEELTYRVGPFEILFEKNKILAFLTASLLFAAVHSPTDLYSWLLYGSMSLVLTSFYFKYRNFYLNMAIHMLWNFLGISTAFLIN
ncbi:CPBP family intramembrane glutamic endopeptidase [Lactococcus ileimucosae]|uniref:Type II CAAX endopeptidase family protein n=1 Tax=Lactococcus ileimucosae TaxID=2941329 RepID=A0ABV4D4B8_9LACT